MKTLPTYLSLVHLIGAFLISPIQAEDNKSKLLGSWQSRATATIFTFRADGSAVVQKIGEQDPIACEWAFLEEAKKRIKIVSTKKEIKYAGKYKVDILKPDLIKFSDGATSETLDRLKSTADSELLVGIWRFQHSANAKERHDVTVYQKDGTGKTKGIVIDRKNKTYSHIEDQFRWKILGQQYVQWFIHEGKELRPFGCRITKLTKDTFSFRYHNDEIKGTRFKEKSHSLPAPPDGYREIK